MCGDEHREHKLWVGIFLIVASWVVWSLIGCTVTLPPTWFHGSYVLRPQDGGPSGTFSILVSSVDPIFDGGVAGDASAPLPDASPADASIPSTPDSGVIVLGSGLYEPPCCDASTYSPPGATVSQPVLTRPNSPITEPTFKTSISPMPNGYRHEYSQLQAWDGSERYAILRNFESTRIWDEVTKTFVDVDISGMGQRWQGELSNILVWRSEPIRLESVTVPGGVRKTLPFPSSSIYVGPTWETTSQDGRWTLAFIPPDRIVPIDLVAWKVLSEIKVQTMCSGAAPMLDWAAPMRSGAGFVVQWGADGSGLCQGFETFSWSGARMRHIHDHHHHSDLGRLADGSDYLMTYENFHPANNNHPSLVRYDLASGKRTDLRMIPWGRMEHVSCQGGLGAPCAVSASYDFPQNQPLLGEVYLLGQDGSLRRLAHHRSVGCSEYYAQPHASISRSGRRVMFASTWGGGCADIQGYLINLP